MKQLVAIFFFSAFMASCGNDKSYNTDSTDNGAVSTKPPEGKTGDDNPSYDPHRGEGKFTTVDLGTGLNTTLAENGNKVYSVKCAGCHKLTGEKLVGPGWLGVTSRHRPEWILNFITNTDAMINKDPKMQAQLEICLVRMPNQNLADEDARNLLEFMRKNDGVK